MSQAGRVPIVERVQRAREHYEDAATALQCWSSIIPQAIDAWEHEHQSNKRLHLTVFGVELTITLNWHGRERKAQEET